jgi:hypothetical protein
VPAGGEHYRVTGNVQLLGDAQVSEAVRAEAPGGQGQVAYASTQGWIDRAMAELGD